MLFIILHHFIVFGLRSAGYWAEDAITNSGIIFNSFFVIAANCFVLISGYFGIKAKWKGAIRLYVMCVFYAVLFATYSYFFIDGFTIKKLFLSFFPFSYSSLWFIKTYFYLFLLSPILNKIIENCNKKELIVVLLLLGILTFYFGFLWRNSINMNGYNVMNFIFLYFIGRFIALHTSNVTSMKRRTICIGVYLLCTVVILVVIEMIVHLDMNRKWIWRCGYYYNNPLVICSAIAFFCFFRTLSFKIKAINWSATSVLAVYLIHENQCIRSNLYPYINELGQSIDNVGALWLYLLLIAVVILVGCILIDKVRILITNPIEKALNRIGLDNYTDKIINKLDNLMK
ncbi:MAG: acyltransferase [Bacteroidales bacterium]|jgi:surface polysaccharide O-acyltransferase-like enzyme|nr:acyltransferase [Bacteroidales bacterium]